MIHVSPYLSFNGNRIDPADAGLPIPVRNLKLHTLRVSFLSRYERGYFPQNIFLSKHEIQNNAKMNIS
jgi:hypothetical protein